MYHGPSKARCVAAATAPLAASTPAVLGPFQKPMRMAMNIAEKAKSIGSFVRIDMEDSTCTDDTLLVYRELCKTHPNAGIVLQAYLRRTMAEVLRCTKDGITINTFALDIEKSHFPFVEQIAQVNRGRTFYVDTKNLGVYALDSFVRHRAS